MLCQKDKLLDVQRYGVSWAPEKCLPSAGGRIPLCTSGTAAAPLGARIVFGEGVCR